MFTYPGGAAVVGDLQHNVQYVADVSGLDGLKNIQSIFFSTPATANVRVDCIRVSFDGSTSDPAGDGVCNLEAPTTTPVPLPAGLPLLLAGLGALAVFRRSRG